MNVINLRSSISLDRYGSKVQKVSSCIPAVSNEIILATRQDFFFKKGSSCKKHKWHCIIGFLIKASLLNVYLILHYHLFFRKEM